MYLHVNLFHAYYVNIIPLCFNYIFQMLPLIGTLMQLVKTGFTKAVQRLDGIYALLLVAKIAAVDIKAGLY